MGSSSATDDLDPYGEFPNPALPVHIRIGNHEIKTYDPPLGSVAEVVAKAATEITHVQVTADTVWTYYALDNWHDDCRRVDVKELT